MKPDYSSRKHTCNKCGERINLPAWITDRLPDKAGTYLVTILMEIETNGEITASERTVKLAEYNNGDFMVNSNFTSSKSLCGFEQAYNPYYSNMLAWMPNSNNSFKVWEKIIAWQEVHPYEDEG